MIENLCVKCGAPLTDIDTTNRLVAPCCADCRAEVAKETKKNYSMWPHDYRGGWLWDGKQWVNAKVYDVTP